MLIAAQVSAQELSVKKGMVIDSLKVSDTLQETYALYVPTKFQGKKTWPVLFIFDGEGRGKAAAHLFRYPAEQQGYIVVSSNNIASDNDLKTNVEIADRLLQEAVRMFPINTKLISSAGSMEGGKVATTIPLLYEDIQGVIAVGNHWMNLNLLDKNKEFSFIGVVGDEQFTSAGMNYTAQILRNLKFPSRVYTYEGDKEWPDAGIISSAVGSLTLDAMKKNLRPVDPPLIDELYKQDLVLVNKMISNLELVEAMSFLELLEEKYDGLRDLDEIREKQKQLRRSRNYASQDRERAEVSEKELRLIDDFIYYLGEDIRTANFENLGWWNYQKIQLDSLAAKGGAEAKMAKRLEGFINELAKTRRQELENEHAALEKKMVANMIQTIFNPHNYQAYKNIISLSAQDNDFGTALFYLEEMLKHGYKNKDGLYNIEGTLGLRLTPEYNAIIEKYLGTARYYDN